MPADLQAVEADERDVAARVEREPERGRVGLLEVDGGVADQDADRIRGARAVGVPRRARPDEDVDAVALEAVAAEGEVAVDLEDPVEARELDVRGDERPSVSAALDVDRDALPAADVDDLVNGRGVTGVLDGQANGAVQVEDARDTHRGGAGNDS